MEFVNIKTGEVIEVLEGLDEGLELKEYENPQDFIPNRGDFNG